MIERITSRQNSLLVRAVKLQTSKKYRRMEHAFVGDGIKLLAEAIKWAPERLEAVILQEGVSCPELPQGVRAVEISEGLMAQISRMEAPEGAMFLCGMASEQMAELRPGTLVLDGIQDPGNVGTILRTADALDVPVVLTEGCADPYNEKTVRATMGAIFRTPPMTMTRETLIALCRKKGLPLAVTALSETAKDIRDFRMGSCVTVIGSEGKGVSEELLDSSDLQLIIPMNPRCESLNAASAASIVLWEVVRDRRN